MNGGICYGRRDEDNAVLEEHVETMDDYAAELEASFKRVKKAIQLQEQ